MNNKTAILLPLLIALAFACGMWVQRAFQKSATPFLNPVPSKMESVMQLIKKEYVETLIRAMKHGVTDLTKYKENGVPVWKEEWADQPVLDVHHIINIKDSATKEAEGQDFTHINDYENMCFIVRYPEHDAMHALEQDLQGNYREDIFRNRQIGKKMFYRIQPPPGVRCMLGFHNMIYDRNYLGLPEKEKKELNEKAENNPNRINGKHTNNKKHDSHFQRREWRNKGRYYAQS